MQDKNYYREAMDRLREMREDSLAESEEKKLILWEALPQVKVIDAELSTTAAKMFEAIMTPGVGVAGVERITESNKVLRAKRDEILLQNGYEKDFSDIKYHCKRCSDSGFVGIDMCSCVKSMIAKARLEDSELGKLCRFQSFENFSFDYYSPGEERENIETVYKKLYEFADGFNSESGDSWLLVGDTGLGKTHLSTAVGARVIERGYDVVYRSIQGLIDDFEQVQFRGESSFVTKKYFECDLLIIDDLGAEMTNSFTISCLYNIINTRMIKGKPTMINTNLGYKEMRQRYEDRITSRLFGEYKPVRFIGKDIRRQRLGGISAKK